MIKIHLKLLYDYQKHCNKQIILEYFDMEFSAFRNKDFEEKNDRGFRPCFLNGLYDLSSNEIKQVEKNDFCYFSFPYYYHKDCICEPLEEFIKEIFPKKEMADYFWKCLSNALFPDKEKTIIFFHGNGSNGKSTLCSIIQKFFGKFTGPVRNRVLIENKTIPNTADTDLFTLQGKNLLVASEFGKNNIIKGECLKKIIGGDKICARTLYKESIDFFYFQI